MPSAEEITPAELQGEWLVRRVSGFLPPVGIRKRIGARSGSTRVGRIPVAAFRVSGLLLDYRWLPVKDELEGLEGGMWQGRGLVLGREFCRFRLVRPE